MIDKKRFFRSNVIAAAFIYLVFVLTVLISFYYASSIVSDQMQIIGEEVMNTTDAVVSANLTETQLTFSNLSQTVQSMLRTDRSNAEILDFLSSINDLFIDESSALPDFMKAYAYLRGEFLDGSGWIPPKDYDPMQRPWYIGAMGAEDVYFSAPYKDADTGDICISFSRELQDARGQSLGVLAIDLDLSRITDYMRAQRIAGGGYGMVIGRTMNIVGHRDEALQGLRMADISPDYARLANMLMAEETVSAERFDDYDGTDSIAFFRPLFNGWHLGIVTPRASYFGRVYTLAWVLGILGFVSASVLSALLLRTRYDRLVSMEESKSKSAFLSRMSHEMRTPMNAIIGMTAIAKDAKDTEQLHYALDNIDTSAGYLLGVINDVLDISKIESGNFTLSETSFVLEHMVRRASSVAGHGMDAKKLHFSIHVDASVPYAITADEQRLAQVITNLLSNAVKFTPEGGRIALNLSAEAAEGGACLLHVEVTDTGIGMDTQQASRLFQSFQQADNTISRRYGGTGLGLAISRSIVERMGGNIGVESTPGQGSRFFFTVRIGCSSMARMQLPDSIPWKRLRVLTVDSEPEVLAFMEDLAQTTGLTCRKASDGPGALRVLEREGPFDAIFVDLKTRGMDGIEVARQILSGDTGAVVALMATPSDWETVRAAAAALGVRGYLQKPLLSSSIIDWIAEHLAESRSIPEKPQDQNDGIFAGRRALVAEDVDINREILEYFLEPTGIELVAAENGRIAVDMFEADPGRYDLILMDIHMPEMDGYEATRRIRASRNPRGKAIPIIAMTANAFREDIEHCLAAGMNDHIGKPIDTAGLIAAMKRYL